jgi:iron complex transport system substrate-binding protein
LRLALLPLLAAVALLATACGADDPDDAAQRPATTPQSAAHPVTIEHAYGSTEIPAAPKRVLTLGLSDQDAVLALGVKPIAVSEWYGEYPQATWPWARDELGSAKPVVLNGGERDEANPPFEEIAALKPDLILSLYNGTTRKQYELLSQIAPTVVPTKEFADFTITWQEATMVTGKALGREEQARTLVEGLDRKFAAAAEEHPEFAGKRVVVAERFKPGESVVRSGNDIRAKFFADLGYAPPTEIAGRKPNQYGEIEVSDERMSALSRDLLVWNIGADPSVREDIEGFRGYAKLPVVQDGKVLWLEDPEISGAFTWGTVLSLDFALQELLPQVTDVVRE